MNIETVPIDAISPDPSNARRHPQRNLEQIKASLRRFGQQKQGIFISGLDFQHLPCRRPRFARAAHRKKGKAEL